MLTVKNIRHFNRAEFLRNIVIVASPPKENHKIEIRCNKGGLDNVKIIKKLKLIEDKIRKTLNKTSILKGKPSTKVELTTASTMKNNSNNKKTTKSKGKTSPTPTPTEPPTTTMAIEKTTPPDDEYLDFLNKELNELELGEEDNILNTDLQIDDVAKVVNEKPTNNLNLKPNDNKVERVNNNNISPNIKTFGNSPDLEWRKAIGHMNENIDNSHKDHDMNNMGGLMPSVLPVDSQNLGNNQLAHFNAKSGAAAQRQDFNSKDTDIQPSGNTGN